MTLDPLERFPTSGVGPRMSGLPGADPRLAAAEFAPTIHGVTLKDVGLESLLASAAFDPSVWPGTGLDRLDGGRVDRFSLPNGGMVYAVLRDDYRLPNVGHLGIVLRELADRTIDPTRWLFVEETALPGVDAAASGPGGKLIAEIAATTGISVVPAVKNLNSSQPFAGAVDRLAHYSPPISEKLFFGCATIVRAHFSAPTFVDYFGAVKEASSAWGVPVDEVMYDGVRHLLRDSPMETERKWGRLLGVVSELEGSFGRGFVLEDFADVELLCAAAATGSKPLTRAEVLGILIHQFAPQFVTGEGPNLAGAILTTNEIHGEKAPVEFLHDAVVEAYRLPRARREYLSRLQSELLAEEEPRAAEASLTSLFTERNDLTVAIVFAHAKFARNISSAVGKAWPID